MPRGFLRTYLLAKLSRHEDTGYSIMQSISEKTEGTWRPGPGTIYPMFRKLTKEGLIVPVASGKHKGRESVTFSITKKGKLELEEMQKVIIAHAGQKREGMMAVFAELLPASRLVPLFLAQIDCGFDVFLRKASELPPRERKGALRELKKILSVQLSKIS